MASSSDFFEIFATEPNAATGVTFARYMELAMYHPTAGYYTRDFKRVGRDEKADFFTATSFSPVFGELVVAAAAAGPLPLPRGRHWRARHGPWHPAPRQVRRVRGHPLHRHAQDPLLPHNRGRPPPPRRPRRAGEWRRV